MFAQMKHSLRQNARKECYDHQEPHELSPLAESTKSKARADHSYQRPECDARWLWHRSGLNGQSRDSIPIVPEPEVKRGDGQIGKIGKIAPRAAPPFIAVFVNKFNKSPSGLMLMLPLFCLSAAETKK